MGRVESIRCHGCLAKVLKDVCKKEHITAEVNIMVLFQIFTVESRPHFLCMLIVLIAA